jgi:hypothetical protein
MLTLISARRGLGGTLRRYQHDRLGIITTVTQSATPSAQIIRIQGQQAMAGLHSGVLEAGPTKNPISDQGTVIKASKNFRPDAALCPHLRRRPQGVVGGFRLDCLLAQITRNRERREVLPTKTRTKTPRGKPCRICKTSKPLDSFGKHRLTRNGHRDECKACVKAEHTNSTPRC